MTTSIHIHQALRRIELPRLVFLPLLIGIESIGMLIIVCAVVAEHTLKRLITSGITRGLPYVFTAMVLTASVSTFFASSAACFSIFSFIILFIIALRVTTPPRPPVILHLPPPINPLLCEV